MTEQTDELGRVQHHIRAARPDTPVYFFRQEALRQKARHFLRAFPGRVSYAVKANPSPHMLRTLGAEGVTCFDVASPKEMRAARAAVPWARLHYHNPVRSAAEIAEAKRMGVASWSVDRFSELDKLGAIPPDSEVAVRLSLPRKGGAYDFGSKFGAAPDLAEALLRAVAERGMRASMTFHPGTQCGDAGAWVHYIEAAAKIAARAGVTLSSLNVGGGFPSLVAQRGQGLGAIFSAIGAGCARAFAGHTPEVWCEPGRGMVAESMWVLLRIKGLGPRSVTLNDGIYGALAEWRDMAVPTRYHLLSPQGVMRSGAFRPVTVFGPTCDSLDRLPQDMRLPETVEEGDYLLIEGVGAYSQALVTGFNGYGARDVVTLDDSGQQRLVG